MAITRPFALQVLVMSALAASSCVLGGSQEPLTIEPETIPPAAAGRYYEVVYRSGGALTVAGLPLGLELVQVRNGSVLFGVAPAAGTYSFSLTAAVNPTMFSDPPPSVRRTYALVVEPSTADNGLLFVQDDELTFTAAEAFSVDLNRAVRGGQPPYRFALYCSARPGICADPNPIYEEPRGVSLSEDGLLAGTVNPYSGVPAQTRPRSYLMFLCVTDAAAAHACESVTLSEILVPTPAPS